MAQKISISLGDHFTRFVAQEVASGRYRSASDVVRAGLGLLEQRQPMGSRLWESQDSAIPLDLPERRVEPARQLDL